MKGQLHVIVPVSENELKFIPTYCGYRIRICLGNYIIQVNYHLSVIYNHRSSLSLSQGQPD